MTKSTFYVEEDKILATLFEEGMDYLHLYKPGSSPLYAERLISLLPDEYYKKMTVHEHFYLQKEFGLRGIHIDSPTEGAPASYKGRISRSCTDLAQLKDMKKQSDYVFLKNIFNCIEFPNEKSTFSMEQLEEASRHGLIDRHVYALGGMSLENIHVAKELGFGGVVICGDLWNRFDIHQERDFKEIISHFERLRKAVG